jgi:hypothetical protein
MRFLALCFATTVAAVAAATLLSTRGVSAAPPIDDRRVRNQLPSQSNRFRQLTFPIAFSMN